MSLREYYLNLSKKDREIVRPVKEKEEAM